MSALIDHVVRISVAEEHRRCWLPREEAFLREHLGNLSFAQIGEYLGRSENAVKIVQVRRRIPSASKRPGYYTGNQAAKLLCVDIHNITLLHKRGILKFQILPGERRIMQIKRQALWVWAVNPENWIYFKPGRIRNARLRRLIELRKERWNDEWWTPGQAADYFKHTTTSMINHAIHQGRLRAKRWGNWWIKRSDVLALRSWKSKGGKGIERGGWTPRGDAFLLKAREEWGLVYQDIARLMKWPEKRVFYRYHTLKKGSSHERPGSA